MATRFSGADPSSLEALNNLEVLVRLDDVSERMSTIPHWVTTKVPNLTKADADTWTGNDLCCACWGWSLVLPGGVDGRGRTILFDAGPAEYAINHTFLRLGIDMGAIEAVVLPRIYIDHAGSLPAALRNNTEVHGGQSVSEPGTTTRCIPPRALWE